jgi:hypothetical protein
MVKVVQKVLTKEMLFSKWKRTPVPSGVLHKPTRNAKTGRSANNANNTEDADRSSMRKCKQGGNAGYIA